MNTSQTINKLAGAMSSFQGEVENARKTEANQFSQNSYADLAEIWNTIRAPLAKHKLSVIQGVACEGSQVKITTRLMHESGDWAEDTLTLTSAKNDPQGIGSTITYGRRYALAAMVGIAQEDDDGNDGSGHSDRKPASKQEQKPEPKKAAPKQEAEPIPEAEPWPKEWERRARALSGKVSTWDKAIREKLEIGGLVSAAKNEPDLLIVAELRVEAQAKHPDKLEAVLKAGADIPAIEAVLNGTDQLF